MAKMISFARRNYSPAAGRATDPMPQIFHGPAMNQSTRKLLGTLFVIGSVFVYAGLVLWLYTSFLEGQPWYVLIVFFAVTGVGWFFPASWIIRWMSKPDA
jgi:RsiW-degrading membrane proteinase PrsW (M82 family)